MHPADGVTTPLIKYPDHAMICQEITFRATVADCTRLVRQVIPCMRFALKLCGELPGK